jgi:hypothetical protein
MVKTECQLFAVKVRSHLVVVQILKYAQEVVKETSTAHSFLLAKQTIVQTLHLNSQFPMGVAENLLFPLVRRASSHQQNHLQILPL